MKSHLAAHSKLVDNLRRWANVGGSLATCRGDEHILSFLFTYRLQFQPSNNIKQ